MNPNRKFSWKKAVGMLLISACLGRPLMSQAGWSNTGTTNTFDGDYTNSMAWTGNELVGDYVTNITIFQDADGEAWMKKESHIDAIVQGDDNGLSLSASNSTSAEIYVGGDGYLNDKTGAYSIAQVKLGAGYTWVGAYGYPSGPEHFPIHISISADGECDASGLTYGNSDYPGEATAGAAYVGTISTSPTLDGSDKDGGTNWVHHGNFSFVGSAEGLTTPTNGSVELVLGGDSVHTNSYYPGNATFQVGGGSGYSFDEDYLIDTAGAAPPDVAAEITFYTESAATLKQVRGPAEPHAKVADSSADASLTGAVSWAFGTAY